MDRFDKGEDFTAFWDKILSDNGYSEDELEEFDKFVANSISSAILDNPRPIELIGDFDDDLPF